MSKKENVSINVLNSVLDCFRDKDKKKIARYLYKSVREMRKKLKKEG